MAGLQQTVMTSILRCRSMDLQGKKKKVQRSHAKNNALPAVPHCQSGQELHLY